MQKISASPFETKADNFALTLFLCFSLQNVLNGINKMKESEREWAWEQVCVCAEMLFPTPFEA